MKVANLVVENAGVLSKEAKLLQGTIAVTAGSISDGASASVLIPFAGAKPGDKVDIVPLRGPVADVVFTAVSGRAGTATAGAASTITLDSGAIATNDVYNGYTIRIVEGTGAGQVRTIADYVGTTKVATVDSAWTTNPDNTSVFHIEGFLAVTVANDTGGAYEPAAVPFAAHLISR